MKEEEALMAREALLAELQRVFDAQTSETLLNVLNKVITQAHQADIERGNLDDLKKALTGLVAAQARTEEVLKTLAEAQRRTEEQVRALTEVYQRTEERVSGLEAAMERLAEAQRRTEEQVRALTEIYQRTEEQVKKLAAAQTRTERALEKLSQQVGGLSETVGGDIEDIAYIVLYNVLKREFGWQVGVLKCTWQVWDKHPEEVNVFGQASDPTRPGQTIWIVGEAKHNLTVKEVKRFVRQVERARQHLIGEIFAVCFCYRARPEVQQMVRDAGLRLVFSYGELI